jgi:phospholipase C
MVRKSTAGLPRIASLCLIASCGVPDPAEDPVPLCAPVRDTTKAGADNPTLAVQHIVILVQENHSFDHYLGRLAAPDARGSEVDGVPFVEPTDDGHSWSGPGSAAYRGPFHESAPCTRDPSHSWNGQHIDWNGGRNDGFVSQASGDWIMGVYDASDLPYYYALADRFAIADRYFASVMGPTGPNRLFLFAGSSFGHVRNDYPSPGEPVPTTIFDRLDAAAVDWKYYAEGGGYECSYFPALCERDGARRASIDDYHHDLAMGALPQVAFLDSNEDVTDEHPSANVQAGQAWVAARIDALVASSAWPSTVAFLTWDESGGFYDHVPPPRACPPDDIAPILDASTLPGGFDRYGFRVPLIAISPYSRPHHVSHAVYDHTSILRFIETRFALSPMGRRDAAADPMLDLFDFDHPAPSWVPPAPPAITPCQPG